MTQIGRAVEMGFGRCRRGSPGGDTAGVPIARTRAKRVVLAWFFGFEPGDCGGFKSATLAGTVAHGG